MFFFPNALMQECARFSLFPAAFHQMCGRTQDYLPNSFGFFSPTFGVQIARWQVHASKIKVVPDSHVRRSCAVQ
jgi:hypothetical protein